MKYENKVWIFLTFLLVGNIIEYPFYVVNVFMKKVIKQLWQLIFKHRKKIIYGIFAFLITQIWFLNLWWIWIENEVYADSNSNTTSQSDIFQEKATEWYEKFSFFQKIIYAFLYPLLVVAWKLADNSLVYGEVFGFDAVLRQLWNIMKNLSNFALWFLFVYKIFEYLLKWQKSWEMKKLLVSSLIAWVWIQASWFIMAALIDVSTILTYWVWWLPINILKENSSKTDEESLKHNPYMLKDVIYLDINDPDIITSYRTNRTGDRSGDFYISECRTFSYKYDNGANSEELLLSPKMIYYADEKGNINKTEKLKCHKFGQVYIFQSLYEGDCDKCKLDSLWPTCSSLEDCKKKQENYNWYMTSAEDEIKANDKDVSFVKGLIQGYKILEIWNAHITWGIAWGLKVYYWESEYGLDRYNKYTWEWKTSRLQDVLDWNSYVWVFTALYSSLVSSIGVIPTDAWIFSALLNVALSLWHMLAIAIPLIAVAIVFMMRIWIIWIAVAIAPFIILLTAFGLSSKVFKGDFLQYFDVKNLIIIIFAPAIICFAISISTILVVIINNLNVEWIITEPTEILWWLIRINIWWLAVPIWKLIIAVFWIAITWFLVWAAVETSKLWQSGIIKSLKWLATSALWSMPIIPVVWRDADWKLKTTMVWASTAFGGWWIVSKMMNEQIREYQKSDSEVVQNFINPDIAKEKRDNYYKGQITNITETPADWTTYEVTINPEDKGGTPIKYKFADVADNRKEDIINAINAMDKTKRAKLVGTKTEVRFNNWKGDVVYKFDSDKGYVKQ